MAETAESNTSAQDILSKSQEEFLKNWADAYKNWTETVASCQKSIIDQDWLWKASAGSPGRLADLYGSWKSASTKYFDALGKLYPSSAGAHGADKLLEGADAYVRLYEFWLPLATAIHEKTLDANAWKSLMDPVKYKDLIDKVFGFDSPKAVTDFFGYLAGLLGTMGARGQTFIQPWLDAARIHANSWPAAAAGDTDASLKIFRDFHAAFESTFGKALNMPAVGKDRESLQLLSKTIDRYGIFLARSVEFQNTICSVAQKAMEQVVATLAQKVRNNEPISGFSEFIKLWTAINEKAFIDLFKTEEFSRLQGVLLDASLDARKSMQKLMESRLRDLPIALRSEMDDVYRTNHELNKSVRALKKRVAALEENAKPKARKPRVK